MVIIEPRAEKLSQQDQKVDFLKPRVDFATKSFGFSWNFWRGWLTLQKMHLKRLIFAQIQTGTKRLVFRIIYTIILLRLHKIACKQGDSK